MPKVLTFPHKKSFESADFAEIVIHIDATGGVTIQRLGAKTQKADAHLEKGVFAMHKVIKGMAHPPG